MAAYAGTTTVLWYTQWGDKIVALLEVQVTNYNATGIPLGEVAVVGLNTIECVIPFTKGGLGNANAPLALSWDATNDVVLAYKAVNSAVADDTNIYTTLGITIYLLVIGF